MPSTSRFTSLPSPIQFGSHPLDLSNAHLSKLVDFVIWLLFNRTFPHEAKPPHVLCHGMQRAAATWQNGVSTGIGSRIPGVICVSPNEHIETLKSALWTEVVDMLGEAGERIFTDLLIGHDLFVPLTVAPGNFYQLSGE